ncbi:MAG: RNA-binding S4 domain-containing protein [Ideonella sp.]
MSEVVFTLRGDFIPLDALLKACGLASSGGDAKQMVLAGMVSVDGSAESRRTCKIRSGQRVECAGTTVNVVAGPPA